MLVMYYTKCLFIFTGLDSNKASLYDQEILQSQTADKPTAPRGRALQQSRDTRKTKIKASSSVFAIKMITKLEWT